MEESWNRLFLLRQLKRNEKAQSRRIIPTSVAFAVRYSRFILQQTDGHIRPDRATRLSGFADMNAGGLT